MSQNFQGFDNFGEMMADRGSRSTHDYRSPREKAENALIDFGFGRIKFTPQFVDVVNDKELKIRLYQKNDRYDIYNPDGSLHSMGKATELVKKLDLRNKKKIEESPVE
jgi:hypothetical protein